MTQTSNRFFDELAKLMTDAAGVAQGVRREAETAFRTQVERWIADLDLVKREDFEVVREMASKARAENDRLAARVAELEARLGVGERSGSQEGSPAPAKLAGEATASPSGPSS
jgi:BMFP domain-containing protein YqiC